MAQREFGQYLVAVANKRKENFHRISDEAREAGYERARTREVLDRTVLLDVEDVLKEAGDDISPLREDLISKRMPIQTLIELGDLTDEFWQSVASRTVDDIKGTVARIHMRLLETTRRDPFSNVRLYSALYPSPLLLDSE